MMRCASENRNSPPIGAPASVRNLVNHTVTNYCKLDIALLNSDIEGDPAAIDEYGSDTFDTVIAVNVRGNSAKT